MKTILVIDDSDDVRSFVVTTLELAGYSTLEAFDARHGVQLAVTAKPDLILCDVNMPEMDGFETLAVIRQRPDLAATPFILITGSVDHTGFRRGMNCGADDFLPKPFSADELVQAVVSRLVRHSELEWESIQRAEKMHHDAVNKMSSELSAPLNGLLGAITSIMVDYAAMNPEGAYTTSRQINESAARLNELAQSWST